MHKQHYSAIEDELGVEVATGVPFTMTYAVFAGVSIDMQMCIVPLPRLGKSIVDILEKFLMHS